MRRVLLPCVLLLILLASTLTAFWLGRDTAPHQPVLKTTGLPAPLPATQQEDQPTRLYAHNILLRKGPHFRVYVSWIRGEMERTQRDRNPSFDVPASFILAIDKGVLSVKLKDLADFLNAGLTSAPLTNVTLQSAGGLIKLRGTVHKLKLPLPIELDGALAPLPDGRIRFRVSRLNVLKVPLKGLLGLVHVQLDDLMPAMTLPGVQLSGNDILFDTQRLLPPPHIHGLITSVIASPTDLQVRYGNAQNQEDELARWHNFLRLSGGTLDFGKLTMHPVDLTMIDATDDRWFDLDLVNYQAQLVYGTTRMTAEAGLEIYMPNVDNLPTLKAAQGVTLEWLKNKDLAPPLDATSPTALAAPAQPTSRQHATDATTTAKPSPQIR